MSGLSEMAIATYSTKRSPSKVAGKTGESVANLTGVKCLPIMPLVQGVETTPQYANKALSGRVKGYWITSCEYQTHTDGETEVTQLPDIIERDKLVVGSDEYTVRDAQSWPATSSTLAYLYLLIEESR